MNYVKLKRINSYLNIKSDRIFQFYSVHNENPQFASHQYVHQASVLSLEAIKFLNYKKVLNPLLLQEIWETAEQRTMYVP